MATIHENMDPSKMQTTETKKIGKFSNYFIVCLSPSNYTCVTYPYPVEAKPGMIFKIHGEMVQVLRVSDSFSGLKQIDDTLQLLENSKEEEEYEKTL